MCENPPIRANRPPTLGVSPKHEWTVVVAICNIAGTFTPRAKGNVALCYFFTGSNALVRQHTRQRRIRRSVTWGRYRNVLRSSSFLTENNSSSLQYRLVPRLRDFCNAGTLNLRLNCCGLISVTMPLITHRRNCRATNDDIYLRLTFTCRWLHAVQKSSTSSHHVVCSSCLVPVDDCSFACVEF